MKILIAGLLQFDSGKTSLAAALTVLARMRGFNAVAVKPVGGHSFWSQFDTLIRSERLGKLVGEDAYILWKASGKVEPLEVISPFDVATIALDIGKIRGVSSYFKNSESIFESAVLVRLSKVLHEKIVNEHFVLTDNLQKGVATLAKRVATLAQKLNAKEISKREFAELTVRATYSIDEILSKTFSKYDIVIIESFNNAACPTPASISADKVVIVAPGLAMVFDGTKYRAAIQQLAKIKLLEIVTSDILDIVCPEKIFEIKPRSKDNLYKPLDDTKRILNYLVGG
ncbi:MAG: hypothetical protein J7J67_00860 [Thermoproteales archaeon]|nr:hypothetical protein [Thermoproteales archaeon]